MLSMSIIKTGMSLQTNLIGIRGNTSPQLYSTYYYCRVNIILGVPALHKFPLDKSTWKKKKIYENVLVFKMW